MAANLVDRVCSALTRERVAAAAAFLGERDDRVRAALVTLIPLLIGALAGHARLRSNLRQLHADILSAHVDPLMLQAVPQWSVQQRLPVTLHGGHLAALALFASRIDALAATLADQTRLRPCDARLLIDLATAAVMGTLKQITLGARLDAYQLDQLLATQYVHVATRIDPALTRALGHASVASWLSANGADAATQHPMAPFASERRAQRLPITIEQWIVLLLVASASAIIYATLTPSRVGVHRPAAQSPALHRVGALATQRACASAQAVQRRSLTHEIT